MRRWFAGLLAALSIATFFSAPGAEAGDAPIGRLGDTLRVEFKDIIADVNVSSLAPSPIPPGFGYPPRYRGDPRYNAWPRQQVWRVQVTVTAVQVPNPFIMSRRFSFHGVTPTGDAYQARITDAPDDLQFALQNAPQGATVGGGVWWDCYRDLVTNVVLVNPQTGFHLAQWNV